MYHLTVSKRHNFSEVVVWCYYQTLLLCDVKPEEQCWPPSTFPGALQQLCPPAGWSCQVYLFPKGNSSGFSLPSAEHGGQPKEKAQELLAGFDSFHSFLMSFWSFCLSRASWAVVTQTWAGFSHTYRERCWYLGTSKEDSCLPLRSVIPNLSLA